MNRRRAARDASDLVRRVGHRLRWVWFLAFVQFLAPWFSACALVVIVLGYFGVVDHAPMVGAVGSVVVVIAVAVRALTRPLSVAIAARAADRGLRSGDALITAHELRGAADPGPLDALVHARADRFAAGNRTRDVVPIRLFRRRIAATALLVAVATALSVVPSPSKRTQARHRRETAVVRAQAARLRRSANALGSSPASKGAARQLRAIAAQLDRTPNIREARAALQRNASRLTANVGSGSLAEKAAARGLERSLATKPLTAPGAGGPTASTSSAADQLRAAADQLGSQTTTQREALAQRLEALANAQRAANPELAKALDRAARALRNGDTAAAARALRDAAGAQAAASQRQERTDAARAAASELSQADNALADAQAHSGASSDAGQQQPSPDQSQPGQSQPGQSQTTGQTTGQQQSGQQQGGQQQGGQQQGGQQQGGQQGSQQQSGQGAGAQSRTSGAQPSSRGQGQGEGTGRNAQQGEGNGAANSSRGAEGEGRGQGQGNSVGLGEGQGQGQGRGQGQGGGRAQGRGQAQGPGDGQGQPQGQGGGRANTVSGAQAAGRVGGRNDDGGPNVGTGGSGLPGGTGRQPLDAAVRTNSQASVYDPPNAATAVLSAAPAASQGDGQTIAKVDAPTRQGDVRVSLAQALPRYAKAATAAAQSTSLTPSERSLVRAYFDRLAAAANNTETNSNNSNTAGSKR